MSRIFLSEKWAEIIRDMEGDDIVLEVRVEDVNMDKQNAFFNFLHIKNYNARYFYAGNETKLPSAVDSEAFLNGESKEVIVDLLTCELHYYLNSVEEMEFYTNSIIHLNHDEAAPLFDFMQELGRFINSRISLYIESYPKPSYVFDPLHI
ncbi:hypothetical protein [Parachryseolinea silvisoli]|uniref:hypothetical protein n=1 Tax=Parachryseolinea silvisoli TaxID=2873601 RepID=UPI002265D65D|nr:hypothetical protein [Parachryseolinea silvisoli]MCD9019640.1 hypothetical protein [Parachryseolinea silvisoli]